MFDTTTSPNSKGIELRCSGCDERFVFLTPTHDEGQAGDLLSQLVFDRPSPISACCHVELTGRLLGYRSVIRFDTSDTTEPHVKQRGKNGVI